MPSQAITAPPSPKAPKKNEPVKIASDMDWEKATEAELREFTSLFGKNVPTSFNTEVRLQPGESLLADAYEARPGEFVFSKITPLRKTLDDGTAVIEVSLDCFSVSLTGEHRQILNRTSALKPLGIYVNSVHVEDGVYSLATSAESGYDGGEIHLKASGGFQQLQVPRPREDNVSNPGQ